MGTPGGGVARRGRLLEADVDAAAGGVFDGLLGPVVEVVGLQAVTGKSQGGEMGAGARATHPSDRRTWPRSTQRTMEGSIACGCGMKNGCVCPFNCERVQEVLQAKQGMCSERDERRKVFGNRKGQRKECVWKGTQEGMCSLSDAGGNAQRNGGKSVRKYVSAR